MAIKTIGIVKFEDLMKLIDKVKTDASFMGKADVFINIPGNLAITWVNEFGYCGYFLDFKTGKITYLD